MTRIGLVDRERKPDRFGERRGFAFLTTYISAVAFGTTVFYN